MGLQRSDGDHIWTYNNAKANTFKWSMNEQTFCQTKNSFCGHLPFPQRTLLCCQSQRKIFSKKKERCFWGWKVEAEKPLFPQSKLRFFFLLRRIHQSNHHALYKSEAFMANNSYLFHVCYEYICQVLKQFQTC